MTREIGLCVRDVKYRDNKVLGANMGPTWVLSAPGGPLVGPITLLSGYCCSYLLVASLPLSLTHMGLLPDTQNCGLRMCRECRERFPRHRLQRKPLVSDSDMRHGTCVTHVPWCMSGSLTRVDGETFPAFPAHAQPAILCIWQEARIYEFITWICNHIPWLSKESNR